MSKSGSFVGNETKADMEGAMNGKPTDSNPLHGGLSKVGAMRAGEEPLKAAASHSMGQKPVKGM